MFKNRTGTLTIYTCTGTVNDDIELFARNSKLLHTIIRLPFLVGALTFYHRKAHNMIVANFLTRKFNIIVGCEELFLAFGLLHITLLLLLPLAQRVMFFSNLFYIKYYINLFAVHRNIRPIYDIIRRVIYTTRKGRMRKRAIVLM